MKKRLVGLIICISLALGLSGCNTLGEKSASLSIIYGATAVISLLILIGYCCFARKKNVWFVLLFSSVLVVNIGYTFLSVSTGLEMALLANRISYLGSVLLPMSMLMIILNVTATEHKKWLTAALLVLSVIVFLIAASPGILPIYYKEVSFAVINGVSTLVKVYGPLHPMYLVYLVGYFAAMVAVIIRASVKKTIGTTAHAVILATAVLVNIGVWFIEQLCNIDFEFLSVSYIISELFLLGVHLVVSENQRLKHLVKEKEDALKESAATAKKQSRNSNVSPDMIEFFAEGVGRLTPTERTIFESYITGAATKEIMSELNIKENTLKFHNKNIYGKLGVSSRKQLIEVYTSIKSDKE